MLFHPHPCSLGVKRADPGAELSLSRGAGACVSCQAFPGGLVYLDNREAYTPLPPAYIPSFSSPPLSATLLPFSGMKE